MHFLIYISTSVKLMDQDDLAGLLSHSRVKNIEQGITGMLLYSNGTFIQLLEGEKEDVYRLYSAIQKDHRHKNLIEIITGDQEERSFPDWTMAFLAPDPEQMAELQGYINPLNKELFGDDDQNTAINVLKTFADNNDLTHFQSL